MMKEILNLSNLFAESQKTLNDNIGAKYVKNENDIKETKETQIYTEQSITDIDLQNIETEQTITSIDIRVIELGG